MLERLFLMVAPASAVVGAAAFVVSTVYLAFERCSSCTSFLEGMNRTPALSLTRQVIIGVMIYRVLDCIADMPPAQPAEIPARNCDDLRVSWDGYSGPERLTAADSAWRWSYTKYETGFQVAVYPDAMLDLTTPQFASDQTGRTTVLRASGPPVAYTRPQ